MFNPISRSFIPFFVVSFMACGGGAVTALPKIDLSDESRFQRIGAGPGPEYNLVDNDGGESILDDLPSNLDPQQIMQRFLHLVKNSYFQFFKTFEYVVSHLDRDLENRFDVFLLVNTAPHSAGGADDFVPSQRLRILVRGQGENGVFTRGARGEINGVNPRTLGLRSAVLDGFSPLEKVSTGIPGDGGILTFSGIFRVNHQKSRSVPFQKGMFNSVYIDNVYPNGKVSGIAIHGTPSGNIKRLGQRASHGCARIHPERSKALWDFVLQPALRDENLPEFDRRQQLPVLTGRTSPGQRVLMIFFEGYEGQSI